MTKVLFSSASAPHITSLKCLWSVSGCFPVQSLLFSVCTTCIVVQFCFSLINSLAGRPLHWLTQLCYFSFLLARIFVLNYSLLAMLILSPFSLFKVLFSILSFNFLPSASSDHDDVGIMLYVVCRLYTLTKTRKKQNNLGVSMSHTPHTNGSTPSHPYQRFEIKCGFHYFYTTHACGLSLWYIGIGR